MRKRSIPADGLLAARPRRPAAQTALKKLADEVGCTRRSLALAWVLPSPASSPSQVVQPRAREGNFGALEVKLSPKILADLDRAFPPPKASGAGDALSPLLLPRLRGGREGACRRKDARRFQI